MSQIKDLMNRLETLYPYLVLYRIDERRDSLKGSRQSRYDALVKDLEKLRRYGNYGFADAGHASTSAWLVYSKHERAEDLWNDLKGNVSFRLDDLLEVLEIKPSNSHKQP